MKIKSCGNVSQAIEELKNNKNNAVAYIYENEKEHDGILAGCVITLKDLYATKNAPTQSSCQILKNFYPGYDATIVSKLKNAGASIVGKVHLDELGLGGTGEHSSFGLIKNPINSQHIAGGSSSGSVASMTKNISISIGSDTGNSVRLPASYCGLVGFKPSYGAVSRYGMFPFASSLDTVGWFSHNVNDSIVIANVLYGRDKQDFTSIDIPKPNFEIKKPFKIAYFGVEKFLLPNVKLEFNKLLNELKNQNILVEKVSIDQELLNLIPIVYEVVSYSEASSNHANLTGIVFGQRSIGEGWQDVMIKTRSDFLGQMVQKRFTLGSLFLLKENQKEIFNKAQKIRSLLKEKINSIFDHYDYIIYPSSQPAPKFNDKTIHKSWYDELLALANLVGFPSISLPFIKINQMPVGLTIEAKKDHDLELMNVALYFEKILGGKCEK